MIGQTLQRMIDPGTRRVVLPELPFDLARVPRITVTACGSAFYAGMIGRWWLESEARIPVDADVASELRYREPPLAEGGLGLLISQSGETADTLAALRSLRAGGQHVLSVLNVAESTMARESDLVLDTVAGPEICVASTKAFTAQLSVLACLAIATGRARGTLTEAREEELVQALLDLPGRAAELFGGGDARLVLANPRSATPPRWSRKRATCFISAAARTSPSRWKARSSSRRSPTSTPRPMPPAR